MNNCVSCLIIYCRKHLHGCEHEVYTCMYMYMYFLYIYTCTHLQCSYNNYTVYSWTLLHGFTSHNLHLPLLTHQCFSFLTNSVTTLLVDFSQPSQVIRDILCRRYGCRYHNQYGLRYEGNGKLNVYVCLFLHVYMCIYIYSYSTCTYIVFKFVCHSLTLSLFLSFSVSVSVSLSFFSLSLSLSLSSLCLSLSVCLCLCLSLSLSLCLSLSLIDISSSYFIGITLNLAKSLHNQGVLEQEKIDLFKWYDSELVPTSPIRTQLIRKDSQSASMEVSEVRVHVQ